MLVEQIFSQNGFKRIQAGDHIRCRLALMEKSKEEGNVLEFEGLNKWPVGHIVIDRIHLNDAGVGVFSDIFLVFLEGASSQETAVLPFFILGRFLLGKLAAQLSAKQKCVNAKCL